jgi:hypothetical protein
MTTTETDLQAERLRRAALALQTRAAKIEAAAKDATFPLGAEVKVKNDAHAAYYIGQRGVVREHNMSEVGVRFGSTDQTDAYFLRSELERL